MRGDWIEAGECASDWPAASRGIARPCSLRICAFDQNGGKREQHYADNRRAQGKLRGMRLKFFAVLTIFILYSPIFRKGPSVPSQRCESDGEASRVDEPRRHSPASLLDSGLHQCQHHEHTERDRDPSPERRLSPALWRSDEPNDDAQHAEPEYFREHHCPRRNSIEVHEHRPTRSMSSINLNTILIDAGQSLTIPMATDKISAATMPGLTTSRVQIRPARHSGPAGAGLLYECLKVNGEHDGAVD